jgi:Lipid A 3-O-deacylase (PagL)
MRIFSRLDRVLLLLSAVLAFPSQMRAQSPLPSQLPLPHLEQPYAFHRSWSLFSEYSPDSSHIFLGIAEQRKFFNIGGGFTQRLLLKRYVGMSYMAEVKPIMLESDPTLKELITTLSDPYGTVQFDDKLLPALPVISVGPSLITRSRTLNGATYIATYELFYSRRWTYAFGLSPIGLRTTLRPYSRIQPDLTLLGGFVVSPRDIPVFDSSAFNFTFSFGAGVELFQRSKHATRLEYRILHMSNKNIGENNPGVDSQMIQASYVWGK